MERQQEAESQREFELEMMRERQAAQRAAARRSTLAAKLEREATEGFRTKQLENEAQAARLTAEYRADQLEREAEAARLTAEYRASETAQAREEAAALERYRAAERFDRQFGDLASAWSNYVRDEGRDRNLPVDETKTIEFVRRFATQRNIPEERVAEMVSRLGTVQGVTPEVTLPPSSLQTYLAEKEAQKPDVTQSELALQLRDAKEFKEYFENRGIRAVEVPVSTGRIGLAGDPTMGSTPYALDDSRSMIKIEGGSEDERRRYRSVLDEYNRILSLLISGQFRSDR
jgi:hypothetical protein